MKVQIWTAVSVYVLVAIIKKRLDLQSSLYTLLQVFSVTLLKKIPLAKDFLDAKSPLEDGKAYQVDHFNLDVIISAGYRSAHAGCSSVSGQRAFSRTTWSRDTR